MEAEIERSTLSATTTKAWLYETVIKGDVANFFNLLREDPLIVDRCVIENSSLSPLHVAADLGHLDMVKRLINVRPSMCLMHDQDGRNPIHVAAIQGHVDVLQVLHEENPYAAQERTNGGDTILHLCIKHNRLTALEIMLKLTDGDGDQLLNSKDDNGNTVLHLAVTSKQPQMVEYLLKQPKIEMNALNKNNMTVVDIHLKQSRKNLGDAKIDEALKQVKAKPAKDALDQQANEKWLEEQRTSLMVVASLIATVAFQVGVNPPGGVWQDNKKNTTDPHDSSPVPAQFAGESVWSYDSKVYNYNKIIVCNTLALVSSLSVILLLISGLPCKRNFIFLLRITLWITVTATALTYYYSVYGMTFDEVEAAVWNFLANSLLGWLGLIAVVLLGNALRFIWKLLGWHKKESIKRSCTKWFKWFPHGSTNKTKIDYCC